MEQAYEFLTKECGFTYGDAVIVGVSGGPDSMALLHTLLRVQKVYDLEVICAHINHNVRNESNEEAEFVKKYCSLHGATFELMCIEEYGDDNFHNEARTRRYQYFNQLVEKYHAKYIFTAHHGDDLIETVLMRMVRGSTLRGYAGFAKLLNGKIPVIRPLIHVTKEEIIAYNKKHRIASVNDQSNQKDVYTRNRFRKYIVPQLKREDPNVHLKFLKYSKTIFACNDYIDQIVDKKLKKVCPQGILQINLFKKEEAIIQTKIIYRMLEHHYQDDLILITDHHTDLLMDLILSARANSSIHLPLGYKAVKEYETFYFTAIDLSKEKYDFELHDYINLPNGKNIEIVKLNRSDNNFICRLSETEVVFPLHVRTRQDGDKMQVKGMLGSKKINNIFIDEKVPLKDRNTWPVVVDQTGKVVWLPGLKKSKFDKQKNEKYDIILKYY